MMCDSSENTLNSEEMLADSEQLSGEPKPSKETSACTQNEGSEKCENTFKVPVIIETKAKLKKTKADVDVSRKISSESTVEEKSPIQEKPKSKSQAQIPYKEPEWGSTPSPGYSLEILKNGQILSEVCLGDESYKVFGRMECCGIVMEHPSVSRFHAVLQYRGETCEDKEKGFYIYDLESTHGTFLNKNQLRPRTYYRMHVGHMLKLGGSSRMYILQGPEEDEEPEDALTVTELKAKRRELEEEALKKMNDPKEMEAEDAKNEGIDWGFGEDATDDSTAENPFAVSAPNEDLYLEDPKKTLRGWFEREGYELEYNVEEKGFGHFLCRIELPIDSSNGEAVFAEASVKGKKKEAVVAAALEACRILDRHGVLRQSQHDSRKRKEKDWESQDFYDSEEDTFLDRTGTIERKRQFRKRMAKRDDHENIETYDSLVVKLTNVENEIAEVQRKLEEAAKAGKTKSEVNTDQDSLEAFMADLKHMSNLDKRSKTQLNLQLSALQQERLHLEKLVKIAQPTVLPPLQPAAPKSQTDVKKSLMKKLMPMTGAIRGKTLGSLKVSVKSKKPDEKHKTVRTSEKMDAESNKDTVEEEEEEEDEMKEGNEVKEEIPAGKEKEAPPKDASPEVLSENDKTESAIEMKLKDDTTLEESKDKQLEDTSNKAVLGPVWSPEEKLTEEKKKRQRRSNHRKTKLDSLNSDPDYSMWLPPDNQTGDGKTFLNDKFGY